MARLNKGDGKLLSPSSLHQIINESKDILHFLAIYSQNCFDNFNNEAEEVPPNWKPDLFPGKEF